MQDLVTMDEFIQQVWDVEHVRIELKPRPGTVEHLVRSYDYEPLPDDATVDDLKARLDECVNRPFITIMNI